MEIEGSKIVERMVAQERGATRLAKSISIGELDVSDINRFQRNLHWPFFERLRQEAPVHFCARSSYGSYWSISRAADIALVNADYRRFSSHRNVIIGDIPGSFTFPAFMVSDPPEHGRWRRVVAPVLASGALEVLEERCRANICSLLDHLPKDESFDWVECVSTKLTRWMIGALFDLDEEAVEKFISWSEVLTMAEVDSLEQGAADERRQQLDAFETFLMGLIEKRKGCDPARDLASALINGSHASSMICDPALFMGTVSLLIGANETTRSAASGAIVAFNRYPDEWERLRRHPDLIGNAIQEIIRWQTPLAHMRRTATEDVELHGKTIRKGDRVVMWYCSANRDEELFAEAQALRIDRSNVRRHLSYGYGIHRCVGRHAAEMQLRILLEEMRKRFKSVELVAMPRHTRSNYFVGYEALRVRLEY